jgi:hypothetical protein
VDDPQDNVHQFLLFQYLSIFTGVMIVIGERLLSLFPQKLTEAFTAKSITDK